MFNLAALGAGIGEFAQQYRQQQEQALRQQQLQMQLQQFAQRQQEQQRQTAAQVGLAALARSGGLDQQFQGLSPMPMGGGGGMRAGGALTSRPQQSGAGGWGPLAYEAIDEMRSAGASDAFIQGAIANGLAEGGFQQPWQKAGSGENSFGHWQLNARGELPGYQQAFGGDQSTPSQARYLMQRAEQVAPGITKMDDPRRVTDLIGTKFERYQGAAPGQRYGQLAEVQRRMGGQAAGSGSAALATGAGDFAVPSYGEAPAATPDTVVASQQQGPSATPAGYQQPMPEAQYRQQQPGGFGAKDAFSAASQPAAPQQQAPAGTQQQAQADPMAAVQQQVQQGIEKTAQTIPPPLFGRVGLQALMKQIDQVNPGADEATKFMMLEGAQALLAPDAKMQYEYWKQQNDQKLKKELYKYEHDLRMSEPTTGSKLLQGPEGNLHEWRPGQPIPPGWHEPSQDRAQGQPFQDQETKKWYQVTASGDVREVALPGGAVKPSSAAQQIPEELKYPDKWEGMPNAAPPNVRQDVWMASMEYVRTGKMPALGFQPGMRNLVMQASPAAAHALGVEPARVADLQAQYAGMRHAQIVGGGRAAQIELGVQEALKAAPQVIETSKGVPRTQFPTVNQFSNWLQEQGGSTQTVAFREALNTYLNVYASVVSRTGRLTDAQQKHAYELLSTAMNQGQIERGIQQLDYEMQLMKEAVPEAMGALGGLGAPPALRSQTPPAPTPQQQNQQRGASGQRPSWASDEAIASDGSGNKVYYDRDAGRWVDVNRKPIP